MSMSFRCACGAEFGWRRGLERHECPRRHEPLSDRDLLRTLSPRERRAFELRIAGRDAKEAAIAMGVGACTSATLRKKVRRKLGWRHDGLILQARARPQS